MKNLKPELTLIHKDVLKNPLATARMDRMLPHIDSGEIREIDDSDLAQLAGDRWAKCPLWGEVNAPRDPDVVFTVWPFDSPHEQQAKAKKHPELKHRSLNGSWGVKWRNDGDPVHRESAVCTSAWELHSIYGCPFRCAYCYFGTFMNIAVNIEDQIGMLDRWTKLNNFQTVYKWDNATDINCFEPEYNATELFVDYFRDCTHKYFLHYTGKSDNVDFMLDLNHGGKTIIQWSMGADTQSRLIEVGTAPMARRIDAARKCQQAGYIVRYRFSPIIPVKNWQEEYAELVRQIFEQTQPDVISLCFIGWMDLDVLTGCVDPELLDPWALELAHEHRTEMDGKKYRPFPHKVRETVDRFIIDEIRKYSRTTPISLCLESEEMWNVFGKELGRMGDGFLCNCGPVCSPGTAFYENRRTFFAG